MRRKRIRQDEAAQDEFRRPYVIEITSKWYPLVAPGLKPGRRCYYVGETGKDIDERLREHLTGEALHGRRPKSPTRVFGLMRRDQENKPLVKNKDVYLRRTISDPYGVVTGLDAATELEARIIDELRNEGHAVYPEGFGSRDFRSFETWSSRPGSPI